MLLSRSDIKHMFVLSSKPMHVDLERETDYEVRIAMVNVNGTGPFTEWIAGRTEVLAPNGKETTFSFF